VEESAVNNMSTTYTFQQLMDTMFMGVRASTVNVSSRIRNVIMRDALAYALQIFGDGTTATKAVIISAYENWSGAIYEDSDYCSSDCDEE
jgi:hypothetical protein